MSALASAGLYVVTPAIKDDGARLCELVRAALDGGARIACHEGELVFVGPFGVGELTSGETAEFGLAG